MAEAAGGATPKHRAPWARPGWYAEATAWMQAQLAQLDYRLTVPIEQVKSWCLSCILRALTTAGDVYFKAVADLPLFVNEAVVTQLLAERYPRHVPAPLCIDRERGWMLLPDFGRELGWDAPIERRAEALRAFGRLQIDSTKRVDELLAIRCLDRRLDRLIDQIDPLLNSLDTSSGLTETEIVQFRDLGPRLKAMCAALVSYNVPPALVHADMHMSNVARRDGGYLFFDWTDACVAHPFLDMIDILHEKDAAAQVRLRDRYLAVWTDFEPMDRLLEMWAMAYPLCALHQAVSYQHIIANVEDAARQDFGWAMPFWVGKILKQQHLSSSDQGEHSGR
ncbi:MAG: phosphotransferase [Anaerolineae bacterium]